MFINKNMVSDFLETDDKHPEVVHESLFRKNFDPLSEQVSVASLEYWILEFVLLNECQHVLDVKDFVLR